MAGSMTITVADECESYLQALGADIPNWRSKALRSLGWMMQDAIKRGIKSKSPGGKPYPMRHRMSALDRNMMHPELMQSRYPPLGKLVKAIGYQYREKQQAVVVGWLSRSAAALGRKVQDPQPIPVTGKMRRKFFLAGVGMRKSTMAIRPRSYDTIQPMRKVLEPKVIPYLEDKLYEYFQLGPSGVGAGWKKRKKYQVKESF